MVCFNETATFNSTCHFVPARLWSSIWTFPINRSQVKLEKRWQPHVARWPCRAIGMPSSVIEASPSSITFGDTSGCCGHETRSPLRATKRPSNCIVREPVITLPPWSVSSSTRIRFIIIRQRRSMLELRLTGRNPRAVGFQSIRFDPPIYYFWGLRIPIGNGSEFSIVGIGVN